MPADYDTPTLLSPYASFLSIIKERDVDAITLCVSDPTNIPSGAMKWNRASLKLQEYSSGAWTDRLLSLAGGGTGASTASAARSSLGLGTMAVQDANAVAITGGTLAGVTANASIITAGLIAQARLGSGSGGAGAKVLLDNQTWGDAEPVGAGKLWFTNTPPTGYLICDGSSLSTATYASLFAILGYAYGGAGANFSLPDLRQRFPLGKAASGTGNTLAGTGGVIDHTHTGPSHTHTYSDLVNHTHTITITDPGHGHNIYSDNAGGSHAAITETGFFDSTTSGVVLSNTTGITASSSNPAGGGASGTTASSGTGATGSSNAPYLVVNFIIKY